MSKFLSKFGICVIIFDLVDKKRLIVMKMDDVVISIGLNIFNSKVRNVYDLSVDNLVEDKEFTN